MLGNKKRLDSTRGERKRERDRGYKSKTDAESAFNICRYMYFFSF